LGAAPFDAAALAPDFVVGAAYKWLCGPYSSAFCWVAPQHRGGEPIEHGWAARANSEQQSALAEYTADFHAGARRYDVGEVANFALVPATLAAAELVSSWGADAVATHARRLTDRVAAGGEALGLEVAPTALRAPHIVGLRLAPSADPLVVAPALADEGVHVSARGESIRVSAHAYNTDDDVDRLLGALAQILRAGR
jgi:selenocysteine lyase/cysteine desulfurase